MESYNSVSVYPYDPTKGVQYKIYTLEGLAYPISALSDRKDPSIYFTIARALILRSFQFFPMCDPKYIQDRESTGKNLNMFYYNPLVLRVFDTLLGKKDVIIWQNKESIDVWYPVSGIDLGETNQAFQRYGVQISEEPILEQKEVESKQQIGLYVIGGEANLQWSKLQEAVIAGRLINYDLVAVKQLKDDTLNQAKALILTGSFSSDSSQNKEEIGETYEELKALMKRNQALKVIGFGSAFQLLANMNDGAIFEQAQLIPNNKLSFLGRLMLNFQGNYYPLQHVMSSKKLQELSTANILVFSEKEGILVFSSEKILAFAGHPDYNQAFMQELVISDYFKRYHIDPEMNEISHLKAQQTTFEGVFRPEIDDQSWAWEYIEKWFSQ
ncbi:hypothetical protein FGO68_gene4837 [Halteria grandinella]|uniref:Uncharacterized protein n=1 Tax=Halteria grandinella TaxID=5974 RepID=A0A8J8P3Z9_HALGN|nr:hypothetical protein FGO68_gene4837 [Halteria grandinella]